MTTDEQLPEAAAVAAPLPEMIAAMRPKQKLSFRNSWAAFMHTAEQFQYRWDYTEWRPFGGYGVSASGYHRADCSGYASLGAWMAGHLTGHVVRDPLDNHYSGYGNTDTAYAWLRHYPAGGHWFIGDMAFYGSPSKTVHMVICRINAADRSITTKVWSSNGSEAAPELLALNQGPAPLVGVFRHPALG
jgi:hypothetical protein